MRERGGLDSRERVHGETGSLRERKDLEVLGRQQWSEEESGRQPSAFQAAQGDKGLKAADKPEKSTSFPSCVSQICWAPPLRLCWCEVKSLFIICSLPPIFVSL